MSSPASGPEVAGVFTPDDGMASEIDAAARDAGEAFWRMPMRESYWEQMKSEIADMKNTGTRGGGSITAALFLRRFVENDDAKWAHLDIAGTAWKSGAAKGATGRPVALLTHFVLGRCGQ